MFRRTTNGTLWPHQESSSGQLQMGLTGQSGKILLQVNCKWDTGGTETFLLQVNCNWDSLTPPTKFSCRPIANGTHWLHQNCSPVSQLETGLTDVNRRKVVLFVNYFFFFCLYFFPCFLHSSLIAFFHL